MENSGGCHGGLPPSLEVSRTPSQWVISIRWCPDILEVQIPRVVTPDDVLRQKLEHAIWRADFARSLLKEHHFLSTRDQLWKSKDAKLVTQLVALEQEVDDLWRAIAELRASGPSPPSAGS